MGRLGGVGYEVNVSGDRKSVFEFSFDKLAVEAGDVAQRNVLGALGCAGAGVGAVAKTELVHLLHHGAGAAGALDLALGKEGKLADLGRYKQHGRAVFARCDTCAATDTGG